MPNCKTIAICNQKGGVGKTTTAVNLGVGLAMQDKYEIILETDENGEIFIEGLRIGDYTVSEMNNSASSMYVLPDDKTATVKSGATTIVEMHNVVRETPNTGEPDNLSLVLTLIGLSTLGIAASSFLRFKNKKKEEGN